MRVAPLMSSMTKRHATPEFTGVGPEGSRISTYKRPNACGFPHGAMSPPLEDVFGPKKKVHHPALTSASGNYSSCKPTSTQPGAFDVEFEPNMGSILNTLTSMLLSYDLKAALSFLDSLTSPLAHCDQPIAGADLMQSSIHFAKRHHGQQESAEAMDNTESACDCDCPAESEPSNHPPLQAMQLPVWEEHLIAEKQPDEPARRKKRAQSAPNTTVATLSSMHQYEQQHCDLSSKEGTSDSKVVYNNLHPIGEESSCPEGELQLESEEKRHGNVASDLLAISAKGITDCGSFVSAGTVSTCKSSVKAAAGCDPVCDPLSDTFSDEPHSPLSPHRCNLFTNAGEHKGAKSTSFVRSSHCTAAPSSLGSAHSSLSWFSSVHSSFARSIPRSSEVSVSSGGAASPSSGSAQRMEKKRWRAGSKGTIVGRISETSVAASNASSFSHISNFSIFKRFLGRRTGIERIERDFDLMDDLDNCPSPRRPAQKRAATYTGRSGDDFSRAESDVYVPYNRKSSVISLESGADHVVKVDIKDDLDDLSEQQIDWVAAPDKWVCHPSHSSRVTWDILSIGFILGESVVVPLALCLYVTMHPSWNIISTTFFFIEIAINFNTGFYKGSVLIMRRSLITKNYLGTWFLLDLVSSIPWGVAAIYLNGESANSTAAMIRLVKLARLSRLLRLLRIARLVHLLSQLKSVDNTYQMTFCLSVAKMFVSFGMMSHWAACIWIWLGDPNNFATNQPALDNLSTCTMGGPCEPGIEGSPWRRRYGLEHLSLGSQYFVALQFTTGLIVGGESLLQPGCVLERIFTVAMMILGVFACSSIVSQVLLIMGRESEINMDAEEQKHKVRAFMSDRQVSQSLQAKIMRDLDGQNRLQRGMRNDREFIEHLSPWLQVALTEQLNSTIMKTHPFFKRLPPAVMRSICLCAEHAIYAPGDMIVERGTIALRAHFLVRGKLRVEKAVDESRDLYMHPPAWFGDRCLFMACSCSRNVIAVKPSEVLSLSRESLERLCTEFSVLDMHHRKAQANLDNELDQLLTCSKCGMSGHPSDRCPHARIRRSTIAAMTVAINPPPESA